MLAHFEPGTPYIQGPTGVRFLKPSPSCYRRTAINELEERETEEQ